MGRVIFSCVLVCVVLGIVKGRYVADDEPLGSLVEQLPPGFLDQLRELQFEYGDDDIDSYQSDENSEDDWSNYDDVTIPAQLRDIPNWPSQAARSLIGQVGGVAMDTDDNIVVFHRANRMWDRDSFGLFNRFNPALGPIKKDVMMTVKPDTGDVVAQSGSDLFYMPHGLTIDHDGNMWVTDVGLHQVMKIPKGSTTPSLVLGEKLVPGSDDLHFCKPTDVAVASNGEFFVADGYCNGRILKYSSNGTLLNKWGRRYSGFGHPAPDEFNIPHSLALDEGRDHICVADRENGRIQCFEAGLNGTTAGTFKTSFVPARGTIYAIEYDPNADVIYAVNGPGIGQIEGITLDMDGNIMETWGPQRQQFGQPHDVTVSRDGADVYVGDIGQQTKLWGFVRTVAQRPTVGRQVELDDVNNSK